MARRKIINYSKMKLGELIALRDELQAYLEKTQAAKRAAWFKDVMEQAKQYGVDLAKMFGGPRRGRPPKVSANGDGSRASPAPKFRSRKDPSKSWAGRGLQPKWMKQEIVEAKKRGKKLTKEDFRIAA